MVWELGKYAVLVAKDYEMVLRKQTSAGGSNLGVGRSDEGLVILLGFFAYVSKALIS